MLVAEGIEMLELAGYAMGEPQYVYPTLVWDEENVILIDTGYPGQLSAIQAAFWQAGVPFDGLNRVILTHHDIDHIGGINAILKNHPGPIEVLAHQEEKPYINGEKLPLKLEALASKYDSLPAEMKSFFDRLNQAFLNARAPVNATLTDGQVLPYCGGIEVISTPGHTLGHICLYLRRTKTLIAGDALAVEGGLLTRAAAFTNFDSGQAYQSVKKLAQWDVDAVICYHGGLYNQDTNQRIAELAEES